MAVASDGSGMVRFQDCRIGCSHVIDERDDADAAGEGDHPADKEGDDVDRGADGRHDVHGDPVG